MELVQHGFGLQERELGKYKQMDPNMVLFAKKRSLLNSPEARCGQNTMSIGTVF